MNKIIMFCFFSFLLVGLVNAATYPAGTRIIITEVHPDDSDYDDRYEFLCYRAVVPEGKEIKESASKPGYWSGYVALQEGPAVSFGGRQTTEFLTAFKFTLDNTPEAPSEPTLSNEMNIYIPVLNFGNESYWANLQAVTGSDGQLQFKILNYGKKCSSKGL